MRACSSTIFEKACRVTPGGVHSPVRACKSVGISPLIVQSAREDLLFDVDGNRYIDFCGSWGPLILGHAHPRIVAAAQEQLAKGFSYGASTELEVQLAEKICALVPSVQKVRFVSSGTEAVMSALRIARGFTGKNKIVKFAGHYHGHSDSMLVQAGSGVHFISASATSSGVTKGAIADTIVLPFNDFAAAHALFSSHLARDIAAVIVEPIAGNMGVVKPLDGFLQLLRIETSRVGAILIFDEVITGFRVALHGAQGLYRIDPDLSCFGKIIGGGLPVGAVGGKACVMDMLAPLGPVYQAGTLSGNPVAMRVGLETLSMLEEEGFYEALEKKASQFAARLEALLDGRNAVLQRAGSMMTLFLGVSQVKSHADLIQLDTIEYARLFQTLFKQGIYLPPAAQEAWFISSAHTEEHLDEAINAMRLFFE